MKSWFRNAFRMVMVFVVCTVALTVAAFSLKGESETVASVKEETPFVSQPHLDLILKYWGARNLISWNEQVIKDVEANLELQKSNGSVTHQDTLSAAKSIEGRKSNILHLQDFEDATKTEIISAGITVKDHKRLENLCTESYDPRCRLISIKEIFSEVSS
tara:strand:- start:35 stop:514 length:480 start_codon:yes stop_codon:yes gene_type:complete